MPVDPLTFRLALGRFPSGVCIVTTVDGGGRSWGFTASAFSSLSLEPPLILVCLDQRADSHAAFRDAGGFAVSILASHQMELANQFATKAAEKFQGVLVEQAPETGLPVIPEAVVHLECRMHQTIPAGDHTILVGEVVGAAVFDGEPLIYHNRSYGSFRHQDAGAPS